jgi:lipoteichoic acid synthase
MIHLESTRVRSVTSYHEGLETTPFLNELAKHSLLAERAYVGLPRSSKGSVAINCGIDPPLYPGPEFEPGEIPAPCLASLLKGQGYRTIFFQSNSNTMDNFKDVTKGFGYEVKNGTYPGYSLLDPVPEDRTLSWLHQRPHVSGEHQGF